MKQKISYDYDDEADVLYISIGKPKKSITEEYRNFAIHFDQKTKKVVGLTIMSFSEIARSKKPITITAKK